MAETSSTTKTAAPQYSLADQPARVARAQQQHNTRFFDIDTVYDQGRFLNQKRVAVTGANRGLGLALAVEVCRAGAQLVALVRSSSPALEALQPQQIIQGLDVTDDAACAKMSEQITGGPIDIVSGCKINPTIGNQGWCLDACLSFCFQCHLL
jgi:NADPH:quinone reductase-like Zn-dependent oxidoreductase